MTDKEWQVTCKALYIVHRFSTDGISLHSANLKDTVSVLRTHHDSRRKAKYFDIESITNVKAPAWSGEDVRPYSTFIRTYATFVMQRVSHFGPGFVELLDNYAMLLGGGESLSRVRDLIDEGAKLTLKEEQEGPVTVAAVMQVAQDLRDVMEVCAAQLVRCYM
ncbi:unnamed protein product [Choristocarpus tenellus]